MHSDIADLDPLAADRLLGSVVVPRPIAWITSQAADGTGNLAPFSFFNLVSRFPPILMVSFTGEKDTLANVKAWPEFVVHIVSSEWAEVMVASSYEYPPEVDEARELGVPLVPSVRIAVPRLAQAPVALECKVQSMHRVGDGRMVFGEIVHIHVDDAVLHEQRIVLDALKPVARLGGRGYATPTGGVFDMDKPTSETVATLRRRQP